MQDLVEAMKNGDVTCYIFQGDLVFSGKTYGFKDDLKANINGLKWNGPTKAWWASTKRLTKKSTSWLMAHGIDVSFDHVVYEEEQMRRAQYASDLDYMLTTEGGLRDMADEALAGGPTKKRDRIYSDGSAIYQKLGDDEIVVGTV